MYSSLLFFFILVVPIPIIAVRIKRGISPFKACLSGIIGGGIAVALVFIIAQVSGSGIGEELDLAIKDMAKLLAENDQMTKALGIEDSSTSEKIKLITEIYNVGAAILPSTLLIITAIVGYLESIIICRIVKNGEGLRLPMTPIREFSLPGNALMGWIIIFILSWISKAIGINGSDTLLANVDILFEFTFALQGISLIFFTAHIKHIVKVFPVILIIVLIIVPIGKTFLFIIGIADLILGLKGRVKPKS